MGWSRVGSPAGLARKGEQGEQGPQGAIVNRLRSGQNLLFTRTDDKRRPD